MSWAAFHVVEVMSSPRAHLKSVGYLGAIQSFTEDTDVLMLTTNLLKKVCSAPTPYIPQFMRSLGLELYAHRYRHYAQRALAYSHTRSCKRLGSRAHCYAESFEAAYTQTSHSSDVQDVDEIPRGYSSSAAEAGGETRGPRPRCVCYAPTQETYRLRCALAVVAATVNILCELARKNPTDYLSLAPQLFHLLTTSSNNWMLIKIIKLVCSKYQLIPLSNHSRICSLDLCALTSHAW